MTESRNRDLATSIGAAVAADNIATDGSLAISGVTTYTNLSDLPSSNVNAGDLGFVTANNGLYIRGTSGWYVIALVNTSPTYSTSPNSSYNLATDGSTTTVITVVATDPEGFAITYSAIADSGFNGLATVSQGTGNNTNVFTVTPKAQGVATTTSGTLTFRASDSVNNTDVVSTFNLVFITTTENSKKTTFLLKANGNNGTNGTITDSSSSGHTISYNGDAHPSTFTPYKDKGYSTRLNTAQSYIRTGSSADFDIGGTGDWSYEAYIRVDKDHTFGSYIRGFGLGAFYSTPKSFGLLLWDNDNSGYMTVYWHDGAMGRKLISSQKFETGKWNHVAISRTGTHIALFYNGEKIAYNSSYSNSINTGDTYAFIGHTGNGTEGFVGDVRGVRFINGSHTYNAANQIIAVPYDDVATVTNTKLLLGTLPYLKDESGQNQTFTYNGTVEKTATNPFDTEMFDLTSNNASSVFFDGTSDYLSATSSSNFNMGSGDFTAECWFYGSDISSTSGAQAIITTADSSDYQGIWLGINGVNTYFLIGDGGGSWNSYSAGSATLYQNQWYHLAFVRNGNSFKVYLNGVEDSSATSTVTLTNTNNLIRVGGRTVNSQYFHGYVADARVVKGTAVYTSAFTPTTSPLTAITNTQLLINPSAMNIFDKTSRHRVRLSGASTYSSTTRKKHASASIRQTGANSGHGIYFDAKNIDQSLYFNKQNFTIEFWFWLESTISSGEKSLFEFGPGGFSDNLLCQLRSGYGVFIYIDGGTTSGAISGFDSSTMGSANNNMLSSDWTHVAVTRVYDKIYLYLNGTLVDTGSISGTQNFDTDGDYSVGGGYSSGGDYYLEDFRLSLGHVRRPLDSVAKTLTADSNTFLLAFHDSSSTTVSGNWTVSVTSAPTMYDFGPASGMKSVYFTDSVNEILKLTHTGSASDYTLGDDDDGASGNFSVEMWFWFDEDDYSPATHILGNYGARDTADAQFQMGFTSSKLRIRGHTASGSSYGGSGDISLANYVHPRTWHHLYYVEEHIGGEFKFSSYIDGQLMQNGAYNNSTGYDLGQFGLGGRWDDAQAFHGYISNFRIQKGTVAHPVANNRFTVPAAELEG